MQRSTTCPEVIVPQVPAMNNAEDRQPTAAVMFDLDGVLVSTDEQHYLSWKRMADEEGIYFDREINRGCLGVSRMESLEVVLRNAGRRYTQRQKAELAERKNRYYLELVQRLGPEDVLSGAREILCGLKDRAVKVAVASGSKNARYILERVGLAEMPDAVVTGQEISNSKPDPEVFLAAAQRLGLPPARCLVVEDAPAGVEAARRAGMKVLGVGQPGSLPRADRTVASLAEIGVDEMLAI